MHDRNSFRTFEVLKRSPIEMLHATQSLYTTYLLYLATKITKSSRTKGNKNGDDTANEQKRSVSNETANTATNFAMKEMVENKGNLHSGLTNPKEEQVASEKFSLLSILSSNFRT